MIQLIFWTMQLKPQIKTSRIKTCTHHLKPQLINLNNTVIWCQDEGGIPSSCVTRVSAITAILWRKWYSLAMRHWMHRLLVAPVVITTPAKNLSMTILKNKTPLSTRETRLYQRLHTSWASWNKKIVWGTAKMQQLLREIVRWGWGNQWRKSMTRFIKVKANCIDMIKAVIYPSMTIAVWQIGQPSQSPKLWSEEL